MSVPNFEKSDIYTYVRYPVGELRGLLVHGVHAW